MSKHEAHTVDDLVDQISSDLTGFMDQFEVTCFEMAYWCGVGTTTVTRWRKEGPPKERVYEIALRIVEHKGIPIVDLHSPTRAQYQALIRALEWYAEGLNYRALDGSKKTHQSRRRSPISVYRRRVLNDRGARARQALKEVGHVD